MLKQTRQQSRLWVWTTVYGKIKRGRIFVTLCPFKPAGVTCTGRVKKTTTTPVQQICIYQGYLLKVTHVDFPSIHRCQMVKMVCMTFNNPMSCSVSTVYRPVPSLFIWWLKEHLVYEREGFHGGLSTLSEHPHWTPAVNP